MSSGATEALVLIIGYGNPLRGDDGVGWYVAQRIEERMPAGAVCVLTCHQLTPELADPISRSRLAIFIDASVDDGPAQVSRRPLEPASSVAMMLDTHELGPAALLNAARALFGACPRVAALYAIGGESFDHSEQLSPVVREAADRAVGEICREVQNFLAGADTIGGSGGAR